MAWIIVQRKICYFSTEDGAVNKRLIRKEQFVLLDSDKDILWPHQNKIRNILASAQ